MKHLTRIGIALLAYLATISVIHYLKKHDEAAAAAPGAVWAPPVPITPAERNHWRTTEERIRYLVSLEDRRAREDRAARKVPGSRRPLQLSVLGAWTSVIRTNMARYHELYAQAKNHPKGEVPCTICDSASYMPCIMCPNHNGKCVSCGGSGRAEAQELCPSCQGTGKCYLCSGIGKMFCPFCDDGAIRVDWPLPNYFPPAY
jgi:hypothetical protein